MDYTEEFNEYQQELKKKYGTGLATQDIDLSGGYFDGIGDVETIYVKTESK